MRFVCGSFFVPCFFFGAGVLLVFGVVVCAVVSADLVSSFFGLAGFLAAGLTSTSFVVAVFGLALSWSGVFGSFECA